MIGSADAASVAEVVSDLAPKLAATLGSGPPVGLDDRERQEMLALGTSSEAAFRGYRHVGDEYWGASYVDTPAISKELIEVVRADPAWGHAWAFRIVVLGRSTPEAIAAMTEARRTIDPKRDAVGAALIEALAKQRAGHSVDLIKELGALDHEHPDDTLVGWILYGLVIWGMQVDETIAVARQLHVSRPDLQFGGDLAHALRVAGRGDEGAREIRRWSDEMPDNEQALSELALVEAQAGHGDRTEQIAQQVISIHGETPLRMLSFAEPLMLAGKLDLAHEFADKALLGGPLVKSRARYELGVIAVYMGRFAAAYESLQKAADEGRPFGNESSITQTLELLRALAPLVGQPGDKLRYTRELAEAQEGMGSMQEAAVSGFDVAVLQRGSSCPDPERALKGFDDDHGRQTLRRHMIRIAAAAGCASCADVVKAGLASNERSTASLLDFATCAERQGELALARTSLDQAAHLSVAVLADEASIYHAVMARFRLAGVLAKMKDRAGARREYEAFLAHGEAPIDRSPKLPRHGAR